MGWAAHHIEKLKNGQTVQFRPRGHSMTGRVNDGQLVTVEPVTMASRFTALAVGDVVLCKVNGREYLHLIKAVKGVQYQIGNNKGFINGWTTQVFGKVVMVE